VLSGAERGHSEPVSLRESWRRFRRLTRRLEALEAAPPIPPYLPPGRVVLVPGRGEVFVREQEGPAEGPTILLLHGWTVSADLNWWAAYEPLREVGRVIAIDHRGHGRGIRSEETFTLEAAADDAAGVLEVLGISEAIVVGYSMGGPISMLLWRRHPQRVAGLVFEATALEWRATARERWLWKTMGFVERFFRSSRSTSMVDRALREAVLVQPALGAHRAWFKAEVGRGDPREIADAGRALGGYDARPFAGNVDVPVSVVITTRDRLVRPSKQRALAKATHATTFELHGDHDVCWLDGDGFAATTRAAVASVLEQVAPIGRLTDRSA
jgi:3-oxoadipate enol-lactonase